MEQIIWPHGHGSQPLHVNAVADSIKSLGFAKGAEANFDWYNGRLQVLVFAGEADECDEPILHVRYNRDGSVAEIGVDSKFKHLLRPMEAPSPWQEERDKKRKRRKPRKSKHDKYKTGGDDAVGGGELGGQVRCDSERSAGTGEGQDVQGSSAQGPSEG